MRSGRKEKRKWARSPPFPSSSSPSPPSQHQQPERAPALDHDAAPQRSPPASWQANASVLGTEFMPGGVPLAPVSNHTILPHGLPIAANAQKREGINASLPHVDKSLPVTANTAQEAPKLHFRLPANNASSGQPTPKDIPVSNTTADVAGQSQKHVGSPSPVFKHVQPTIIGTPRSTSDDSTPAVSFTTKRHRKAVQSHVDEAPAKR